jgi:endonuclease YncB( thermonuclease family)
MTFVKKLFAVAITAGAAAVLAPGVASAAELHVTARGAGGACSAGEPCGSFGAAYRAAKPGDVIEIGAGSYGEQNVPAATKSGAPIELRGAANGETVVNGLNVRTDNLVVRNVTSRSFVDVSDSESDPVVGVRFYNVHTKTHYINNAQDFVWKGGSIGPSFNDKASMVGGSPASRNLTYDGVYWHDATRNAQDVHMECFYVASVQGITIRNSRFHNCAVFDILFTKLNEPSPSNILLENNVFEASKDVGNDNGYYVFATHQVTDINGLVMRNNVFELPFQVMGTVRNARAVGNIGRVANCQPGVDYAYNVFTSGRCDGTDKVASSAFSQFVNRGAGDWRLKSGAAAIDAADPNDHPSSDAAGLLRNVGRPDAGPYEFGAKTPGGGAGPGSPSPSPSPGGRRATRSKVRVLKVLNGRTLRVRGKHGKRFRVRLLGVRIPVARCGGGRVAKARLRALTGGKGKFVVLVSDPRARQRDAQGRRLRYVIRKRHDIGRVLIASGHARIDATTGPLSRRGSYKAAVRKAKTRNLGVWRCI